MDLTKKEESGYIEKECFDQLSSIIQNITRDLVIAKIKEYKTIVKAAEASGISKNYLWNVIHKKDKMTDKKIIELADIFL